VETGLRGGVTQVSVVFSTPNPGADSGISLYILFKIVPGQCLEPLTGVYVTKKDYANGMRTYLRLMPKQLMQHSNLGA